LFYDFCLKIDVLEGIARAVNGRCEVYFDGGVRTGSDVFKALALGADMVRYGLIYELCHLAAH